MGLERTVISGNNMSFIRDRYHTPREMMDFIENGAMIRSFDYILMQIRPGVDIASILTDGLAAINGDSRESVSKKVRNWIKGRNLPKSRETMFQICFILGLKEREADRLIGRLSDTGIHYRNPEELAYAYALRMGRSYREAQDLKALALRITESTKAEGGGNGGDVVEAYGKPQAFTREVRLAFDEVDSDERFEQFFHEHGMQLGVLHETAYKKFTELLELLQDPGHASGAAAKNGTGACASGNEGSYSLAEVMREYMQLHVPVQQKKGGGRTMGKALSQSKASSSGRTLSMDRPASSGKAAVYGRAASTVGTAEADSGASGYRVSESGAGSRVSVPGAKSGEHSAVAGSGVSATGAGSGVFQKLVRLYWPNETTLIKMKNRKLDVSRKALLLLYLATEAFDDEPESDEDFWLYDDIEDDPDTLLETRIERMDLFLDTYGMNRLDPGNPFDLIMLYSMKTAGDDEARVRMDEVLELLFEEN